MSVSVVAVCIALAAFAVAFLELVRSYEWSKKTSYRLHEFDERINRQGSSMLTLSTLRMELDVVSRNAEARTKLVGCALADRIDALSARMDAVELACGIREKAKTAGGVD